MWFYPPSPMCCHDTHRKQGSTYFLIFSGLWHPRLLILFKRIPAALQSTSLIDACRSGTKQSLVCPQVYRGWEGQYGISKCCRVSFSLQRRQCAASWLGSNTSAWWKHCPISFCCCLTCMSSSMFHSLARLQVFTASHRSINDPHK